MLSVHQLQRQMSAFWGDEWNQLHSLSCVPLSHRVVSEPRVSQVKLIDVGAQSSLGGTTFLPEKYVSKIKKCPNFTRFLSEKLAKYPNFYNIFFRKKLNKIPEFYVIFARKMPKFYIIIARKIFSPNFRWGGGHVPPALPSPTPMVKLNLRGSTPWGLHAAAGFLYRQACFSCYPTFREQSAPHFRRW